MNIVEEIKSLLNLRPHPEGGYFSETYRSDDKFEKESLPDRYNDSRSFGTAIYYMLTPETFSSMHRLRSDEIFHFYMGYPVEMLQLYPDGPGRVIKLGTDIKNGMLPQVIVPKGVWQGSKLVQGGEFALLGTTVSPGFDFADFEVGEREKLVNSYPEFRNLITSLTR